MKPIPQQRKSGTDEIPAGYGQQHQPERSQRIERLDNVDRSNEVQMENEIREYLGDASGDENRPKKMRGADY
jgi:hypothetical protein